MMRFQPFFKHSAWFLLLASVSLNLWHYASQAHEAKLQALRDLAFQAGVQHVSTHIDTMLEKKGVVEFERVRDGRVETLYLVEKPTRIRRP